MSAPQSVEVTTAPEAGLSGRGEGKLEQKSAPLHGTGIDDAWLMQI
jgi:hypothetical protein